MSISVLNLIATSLAALAGSIIGAVIAYKAQLKSSRMSVFTPARISAYGKFEEAIKQSLNGINKTTAAEILNPETCAAWKWHWMKTAACAW